MAWAWVLRRAACAIWALNCEVVDKTEGLTTVATATGGAFSFSGIGFSFSFWSVLSAGEVTALGRTGIGTGLK